MRRLDENSLARQFTAKALIGKDVYDNGGKKIGQVRDVVLDVAANSQLAIGLVAAAGGSAGSSAPLGIPKTSTGSTASDTNAGSTGVSGASAAKGGTGSYGATGTAGSGSPGATGSSATTPGGGSTYAEGRTGSSRTSSSATGSSSVDTISSSLNAISSGPAAILAIGSVMGMGGSLLQVPLSQLSYDQTTQHLRLGVSQSDLTSILNAGETARSATE